MAGGPGVRPLRMFVRRALLRRPNYKEPEPIPRWNVVQGDMVYVRSGRDAGKSGRVLRVLRSENRVIVEGCNLVKRAVKVLAGGKGGIIPMPSPIHYSNVNLLDPTLK